MLPGPPADRALDNDGVISFGLASPYSALPNLAPIGAIDSVLGPVPLTASPVNLYFSDIGDTGPRHTTPHYPHLMRSASGLNIFRQNLATRAGSSIQPRSRKTGPISPPDRMTGSQYGPSDLSDAGRSGRSPSPTSGASEDE